MAAQTQNRPIRIALSGNPNAGKTTLFNALTGARQHVGNYPGVTVELKEGTFTHRGHRVDVVDLPGTYSLTAHSADELVARDYVIEQAPDLVVDVVDASNLERNLYLAVQFMELEVPLVLAFNMWDIVESRGEDVDTDLLGRMFDTSIVRMAASKREGLDALKDAIVDTALRETPRLPAAIPYGREVEDELRKLLPAMNEPLPGTVALHPRWVAVKLLEGDSGVETRLQKSYPHAEAIHEAVTGARHRLEAHFGDTLGVVVAGARYGFISGACREAVRMTPETLHTMSDRIDEIITSRILGVPIFLGLMYLMFKLSFAMGEYPMQWIESLFGWLSNGIASLWPWPAATIVLSLLVDGVLAGVGGVLTFLPTIALLFFAIALLEDSGYMARAAFIMDGLMHRIGLHGKSFIPMLIGFGCTVPAILATRMLESRRDRLSTMLVLPLFSCGARLPIYTLFIGAFFGERWRTPMLMLIYLVGVLTAVLAARLLRSTLFKGESEALVMDLPPYRLPTLRGLLQHTWERSWLFVRKAGTIVVLISAILWVLTSYPKPPQSSLAGLDEDTAAQVSLKHSVAGRIGQAMEPAMRPIGFDWKTTTALLGAVAAKEVFVAQLGIINSLGNAGSESESLRDSLRKQYTQLQAFCIMLFCLMSVPCVVTIVATWKESGHWYWAALQFVGLTVLAYVVTLVVYQGGLLVSRWV